MHLIEVTPAPCAHCGAGNATDPQGNKRQFIDLERDINWNDPLILCEDCIIKLGGMIGMLSTDTLQTMRMEIANRERELSKKDAEIDTMKRRAKKLGIEFTTKEKVTA